MRFVTRDAAVGLLHLVLKLEGALLIDVALDARLVAATGHIQHFGGLSHPERRRKAPMRVMTVGTLHKTFVDAMLRWHLKECAYVAMALIAKLRLTLRKQIFVCRRMMIRVALSTCDVMLCVLRATNVGPVEILCMTGQTRRDDLRRLHQREGPGDCLFTTQSQNVRLGRAVTAFATGTVRRLCARGNAFEMRILIEGSPFRGMTLLTLIVSRIAFFPSFCREDR